MPVFTSNAAPEKMRVIPVPLAPPTLYVDPPPACWKLPDTTSTAPVFHSAIGPPLVFCPVHTTVPFLVNPSIATGEPIVTLPHAPIPFSRDRFVAELPIVNVVRLVPLLVAANVAPSGPTLIVATFEDPVIPELNRRLASSLVSTPAIWFAAGPVTWPLIPQSVTMVLSP